MAYIYDLADTWNASGTTFTAIKMNVTDTASDAASNLMDLQAGGVSRFSVRKNGNLGIGKANNASFSVSAIGAIEASQYFISASNGPIYWSDLLILRDAANTLAQRNGVNAQAFNLYNTYTDASNYERGALRYDGNVLGLHSQALGTGTVRNIQIGGTASGINTHLLVGVSSRLVRFNHSGTTYFEVNTDRGEIRLVIDRTVSTLTTSPAVGMIARVTDATAPAVGSTVVGGGAAAALIWYNGTNWSVIGV